LLHPPGYVQPGGQQTATGVPLAAAIREAIVRARDPALLLPPNLERPAAVVARSL
jgi:hypothetical protein